MASIETPTKIKIISDALILLGEKPLSSLSEDRWGATVGSNLFERVYENELQSNRWRFAMKKEMLARLLDVPLNEWQYAFQLPSDCLLPIGVYPSQQYEIYSDRIYSNASELELDYMFKPEVTAVPRYFAQMLTFAMAREMAMPIKESQAAYGMSDQKYMEQRARAMFADAQGRPNRPFIDSPFTDIR